MIKEAIVKLVDKQDLSYNEAYAVINEIMSGETTATQNAAFLAALSTIALSIHWTMNIWYAMSILQSTLWYLARFSA